MLSAITVQDLQTAVNRMNYQQKEMGRIKN